LGWLQQGCLCCCMVVAGLSPRCEALAEGSHGKGLPRSHTHAWLQVKVVAVTVTAGALFFTEVAAAHAVCVFVHHRWPLFVGQVWPMHMRR